jgi:hypothetical protein
MNGSRQIKPMRIVASFSCRRNRIYPGRGEDASLRELAPSAHPFQRVAITQQSIWRRWKYFPRTSLSQIPSGFAAKIAFCTILIDSTTYSSLKTR